MCKTNTSTKNHASSPLDGDDEAFKNDLVKAFKKIDLDCNGSVSKDELWSHISENGGFGISKKELDVLFGLMDEDNNGAIDFDEYSSFMKELKNRSGGKKRKSSMKFSTQADSLLSCEQPKKEEKKKDRRFSVGKRLSLAGDIFASARHRRLSQTQNLNLNDSNQKSPVRSYSLRFSDVEVREYNVTASDNPCVSSGAGLELGWDYNIQERLNIGTFEEKRSKERSKDFQKKKKLTRLEREKILRELGWTRKEIQEVAKRATIIRNKRRKSIAMVKQDKKHEKVENRLRKLRSLFGFGRKKEKYSTGEAVDVEQFHPTLMVMLGLDVSAVDDSDQ